MSCTLRLSARRFARVASFARVAVVALGVVWMSGWGCGDTVSPPQFDAGDADDVGPDVPVEARFTASVEADGDGFRATMEYVGEPLGDGMFMVYRAERPASVEDGDVGLELITDPPDDIRWATVARLDATPVAADDAGVVTQTWRDDDVERGVDYLYAFELRASEPEALSRFAEEPVWLVRLEEDEPPRGCAAASCVVGEPVCDLEGNRRACVPIVGAEDCADDQGRQLGQPSEEAESCGALACYFGRCTEPPSVASPPLVNPDEEVALEALALELFQPATDRIVVIPEEAFLAAYNGRDFKEATPTQHQLAAKLGAQANDPVTFGLVGELVESETFQGELFVVLRDARLTDSGAVQATDFYVVAAQMTGYTPWRLDQSAFVQGVFTHEQQQARAAGIEAGATPSGQDCCDERGDAGECVVTRRPQIGGDLGGPIGPLGGVCGGGGPEPEFGWAVLSVDQTDGFTTATVVPPGSAEPVAQVQRSNGFPIVSVYNLPDRAWVPLSDDYSGGSLEDLPLETMEVAMQVVMPAPDGGGGERCGQACVEFDTRCDRVRPNCDEFGGGAGSSCYETGTRELLGDTERPDGCDLVPGDACSAAVSRECMRVVGGSFPSGFDGCGGYCPECYERHQNCFDRVGGVGMSSAGGGGNACVPTQSDWCQYAQFAGDVPDACVNHIESPNCPGGADGLCFSESQAELLELMHKGRSCMVPGRDPGACLLGNDGSHCKSLGGNKQMCFVCTSTYECTYVYNAQGNDPLQDASPDAPPVGLPEPSKEERPDKPTVVDRGNYSELEEVMARDLTVATNALTVGDQLEAVTGELVLSPVDLSLPGPARALQFRRRYNSQSDHRGILGSNWTHNFEKQLHVITPVNVEDHLRPPSWIDPYCLQGLVTCVVFEEEGKRRIFYKDLRTGLYMPQAGSTDTIRKLKTGGGFELRRADGHRLRFNGDGLLVEDRDRHGNGFRVEYEPTPIERVYQAYCGAAARNSADPRICAALGYMTGRSYRSEIDPIGGYTAQRDGEEDREPTYGTITLAPPRFFKPGVGECFEIPTQPRLGAAFEEVETETVCIEPSERWVELRDRVIWMNDVLQRGAFPLVPTGQLRGRPTRVEDDLGRALTFVYDDDTTSQDFGLLKEVRGPVGEQVAFGYDAPSAEDFPSRLGERFLVDVTRADDGLIEDDRLVEAPTRSSHYTYQWSDWGAFAADVEDKYRAYYYTTTSCVWESAPQPVQCSVREFQNLTAVTRGNACALAAFEAHRYISSVADNITRVERNRGLDLAGGVLEAVNVYGLDPDAPSYDRVVSQNFGGRWSNATGDDAYNIDLPVHTVDYLEPVALTTGSLVGYEPQPSLPGLLRALYPVEEPLHPERLVFSLAPQRDVFNGSAPPERPICLGGSDGPVGEYAVEDHVQHTDITPDAGLPDYRVCSTGDHALLASALPGTRSGPDYFAPVVETEPGVAVEDHIVLKRTPLHCETIARQFISEAGHNANLSSTTPTNEEGGDRVFVFLAGARDAIARDMNRICAWRKVTDRDARVTWHGLNYAGLSLVTAEASGDGFRIVERVYNADGNIVEDREPVEVDASSGDAWAPGDAVVIHRYEEFDTLTAEQREEELALLPFFWSRRGNRVETVRLPREWELSQIPDHFQWDGVSDRVSADPFAHAQVVRYDYEPLYNLPRSVTYGTRDRQGVHAFHRRVVHQYDYQEFNTTTITNLLRGYGLAGDPYPVDALPGDLDPGLADALRLDLRGEDLNTDGRTGTEHRATGVVVRTLVADDASCPLPPLEFADDVAGCASTRKTLWTWAPHARPTSYRHFREGFGDDVALEVFQTYYPSVLDGGGDAYGPTEPAALGQAQLVLDNSGLLAQRWTRRYDASDVEVPALGPPGCADIPRGPYRYMLDACPDGAEAALQDLGIAQEAIDLILEASVAFNGSSLNTPALYTTTAYSYTPTGREAARSDDGRVTTWVRDSDGLVRAMTDPRETTTSYERTREGWVARETMTDREGAVLTTTLSQYDVNGDLLTRCEPVKAPDACDTLMRDPVAYSLSNSPVSVTRPGSGEYARENPPVLLTTRRYSRTGLDLGGFDVTGLRRVNTYDALRRLVLEVFYDGVDNTPLRRAAHAYAPWGARVASAYGLPADQVEEIHIHDGFNRRILLRDVRGITTASAYDRRGRLIATKQGRGVSYASTDPEPEEVLIQYGFHDERALERVGGVVTRTLQRDGLGRLNAVSETGGGPLPALTFYDLAGNVVMTRDHEGNVSATALDLDAYRRAEVTIERPSPLSAAAWESTAYATTKLTEYDPMMAPVAITTLGANGEEVHESITREGRGLPATHTWLAAEGATEPLRERQQLYNLRGWVTTERAIKDTSGDDEVAAFEYDASGAVIKTEDPSYPTLPTRGVSRQAFDVFGQKVASWMPQHIGETPRDAYTYDSLGRVATHARRHGPGEVIQLGFVYDGDNDGVDDWFLHRVERATGPNPGVLAEWSYDTRGYVASHTDHNRWLPGGQSVEVRRGFARDTLGRVAIEATEVVAGETRSYTTVNSWSLDNNRWVRRVVTPADNEQRRFMDGDRRVYRVERSYAGRPTVDAFIHWLGSVPTGHTTEFGDDADPLVQAHTLDGLGRPDSMTATAYAGAGPSPWEQEFCAGVNASDCATPLMETGLVRDALGRVVSATERFANPAPGLPNQMSGSTHWRGYTYNKHDWLTATWEADAVGFNAATVNADVLPYSAATNADVVALGQAEGATDWAMAREPYVGGLTAITHTPEGGQPVLTRWSASRGEGHLLDTVALGGQQATIAHDDYGRVTEGARHRYVYDTRGRLVTVLDGAGVPLVYHAYDADNRLIRVIDAVTGDVEDHVRDGEQVLQINRYAGAALASTSTMTWGPGMDRLLEVYTRFAAPAPDAPSWEVALPVVDYRNSTRGVLRRTDIDDATLAQRYDYSAYGQLIVRNPSTGDVACDERQPAAQCTPLRTMPFLFQGQWRSPNSGLVYMRNRWYAPELAQFVSPDPLGFVDSYNLYAFTGHDPINRWDPTGLDDEPKVGSLGWIFDYHKNNVERNLESVADGLEFVADEIARCAPGGAQGCLLEDKFQEAVDDALEPLTTTRDEAFDDFDENKAKSNRADDEFLDAMSRQDGSSGPAPNPDDAYRDRNKTKVDAAQDSVQDAGRAVLENGAEAVVNAYIPVEGVTVEINSNPSEGESSISVEIDEEALLEDVGNRVKDRSSDR